MRRSIRSYPHAERNTRETFDPSRAAAASRRASSDSNEHRITLAVVQVVDERLPGDEPAQAMLLVGA